MLKMHVIIASTRPNRVGLPVGKWFFERAKQHGKFDLEWVDLAEVNLPFMDEPNHPMLRQYTKPHTKAWSELVGRADAYTFVTPEYNYSAPPALLNALNYVYHEWNYKPAAFVSYGGASGGLRSVQVTKQSVTAAKMMAIPEGVALPFAPKSLKEGVFDPGDVQDAAVTKMLDEALRWATALKPMRG